MEGRSNHYHRVKTDSRQSVVTIARKGFQQPDDAHRAHETRAHGDHHGHKPRVALGRKRKTKAETKAASSRKNNHTAPHSTWRRSLILVLSDVFRYVLVVRSHHFCCRSIASITIVKPCAAGPNQLLLDRLSIHPDARLPLVWADREPVSSNGRAPANERPPFR
uniref:Uncharacterized protein n=1 Tax=Anopheles melas TaxID=34690 RepID=A0A182TJ76_9DIPT